MSASHAVFRRVVVAVLWSVVLGLILAALRGNWLEVWGACRQPSMYPAFADLRTITGAIESSAQGLDPTLANPMDPWNRPYNYPHIWLVAFAALGIEGNDVVIVGLLFAVLYLATVSWLVLTAASKGEAALIGLAAVSHAALFGIERGNSDLVIFALLVVGLRSSVVWHTAIALPAAALLKVFPLVALAVPCCRRWHRGSGWWFSLGLATAAALLFQHSDIVSILRATPTDDVRSYGVPSLEMMFARGRLQVGDAVPYVLGALGIAAVLVTLVGARRGVRAELADRVDSPAARMFLGFGLVYVATFLIRSNYDYRLLMLLPTLPWWWQVFRCTGRRPTALIPIALVLFVLNVDALGGRGLVAGHVAKVAVALVVLHGIAALVRTRLLPAPAAPPATAVTI